MRPQEILISMGEFCSGHWTVLFGFVWCFLLLACGRFRRAKWVCAAFRFVGRVAVSRPQECACCSSAGKGDAFDVRSFVFQSCRKRM